MRDNTLTAIARRKDSPPTVASLAFSRVLYGAKHPYGWPMTGVEASLKKMTPADLQASSTRPTGGPGTPCSSSRATSPRRRCARSSRPPSSPGSRARSSRASCPRPSPAADKTKIFLIDKADAPQSSIRVGLVGIDRKSPDYFPVTVMNTILGGGFYRLDLNLREGKAWTYGARSSFDARKTPGPFSAGGEFVAAHSAESVGEILKEVNGMRDADVTDAELARARDQITKSFPARFATRGQVAAQLAELAVYGLPDSYLDRLHEEGPRRHEGRRPPRRAQVPRPRAPLDRRRRRPEDPPRPARRRSRPSSCATSRATPRCPVGSRPAPCWRSLRASACGRRDRGSRSLARAARLGLQQSHRAPEASRAARVVAARHRFHPRRGRAFAPRRRVRHPSSPSPQLERSGGWRPPLDLNAWTDAHAPPSAQWAEWAQGEASVRRSAKPRPTTCEFVARADTRLHGMPGGPMRAQRASKPATAASRSRARCERSERASPERRELATPSCRNDPSPGRSDVEQQRGCASRPRGSGRGAASPGTPSRRRRGGPCAARRRR